ncbi:IS66 family transposase [Rhabdochromatium marinum]|uniref:IS66 family transposase n=1 Tax=Rhabdochromatium marinum TaxID=48729 RepID=UPI0019068507|nr:IS66 family transposase [Rhabdochromatium marinum]MBK1650309.1 hypothetical protein [Rhabdochromatium marinum]
MYLSDHDLRQLDDARLDALDATGDLRGLSGRLLSDLKDARDRLNQNASNSSRPPSSRAPWERGEAPAPAAAPGHTDVDKDQDQRPSSRRRAPATEAEADDTSEECATSKPARASTPDEPGASQTPEPRRPGRQPGAPGVSRTQVLPINVERFHVPSHCACCAHGLEGEAAQAHNARYELDLMLPESGQVGLQLEHCKHTYNEVACPHCGHLTQARPGRADPEEGWTVLMSEWRLIGPTLASFIVALTLQLRGSHRRVRTFLADWFGLEISTALISQCRHELGRAVEPPIQEAVRDALAQSQEAYIDETPWPQGAANLWLWVLITSQVIFYSVGRRTAEMFARLIGDYQGWLMSDGYRVYRVYGQRLRCWAHILRKARGLAESTDRRSQHFGQQVLAHFKTLMDSVYQAREGPPQPNGTLRAQHHKTLWDFHDVCHRLVNDPSAPKKALDLAVELLNDWEAFWMVLDDPKWPLTNNEAERALRHWVILRQVQQGTRTEEGSRALANLASVIDTCRLRQCSPWPYLAEVLKARRQNQPAPPIPQAAAH